jgi:hypothetical protein
MSVGFSAGFSAGSSRVLPLFTLRTEWTKRLYIRQFYSPGGAAGRLLARVYSRPWSRWIAQKLVTAIFHFNCLVARARRRLIGRLRPSS